MAGSGTPPPLVPVLDGSSAPTPPLAPGSPPRALSSLATFLEDAVAPSLAPPPEPVRAAVRSHLLRGCQPVTLPLLDVPLLDVLGVLAAGTGDHLPVCLQAWDPGSARQFLSGLLLALLSSPPPALTFPRGPHAWPPGPSALRASPGFPLFLPFSTALSFQRTNTVNSVQSDVLTPTAL